MDDKRRVIVIMAGGSGTRLWPLSRKDDPKQFQALLSKHTLLEETFKRALLVVPEQDIYISTTARYQEKVQAILPNVPTDRLIIEPEARGTAAAILLVTAFFETFSSRTIIATIASDHAIENDDAFAAALTLGLDTIAEDPTKLAVLGINPTAPDTGLGYIKMGGAFKSAHDKEVFFVEEFKEKPTKDQAEIYLADWKYLWNAGYFIFASDTMETWMGEYMDKGAATLKIIKDALATDDQDMLETAYQDCTTDAIEPVLVEKLREESRLVIPTHMIWSDIGTWNSLFSSLKNKYDTDLVLSERVVAHASGNTLVQSRTKKVVALLGVKDLIIIDTEDALLIAHRKDTQDIKILLKSMKDRGYERLL